MKKIILKKGDVYHFNWSKDEYDKQSYGGSLSHCFEGLLIVMDVGMWKEDKKKYKNELRLVDTYWGVSRVDNNKFFTLEKAQERGTLKYYCNLDDLEKIEKYETDEYDDEDLFRLSDQHACVERCIYWYKKIGAKKSPQKKIGVLRERINKEKSGIEYSVRNIKTMSAQIKQLEIKGFE